MPVKTTTPEQPTLPGFGKPPNPKKQIPPEDLAIAQAAEGALEVRTTHGNKASIHQAGNPTPILAIIRHPDGTLEPESSSVQPGRIRLPNPRVPPEQQHDRILFIYHYVKAAAHHQAAIAIEESGYQAGTQRTHEWIDELTKEWATEHRELSPAVHGRTRMWEFIARVSELIDPTAWELAQDTKGHVLIAPYNRAVLNRDILSDLRETNPGASAWAVSRHAGYQPANHPGQIIQSARPFMENIGVERKNWKLVAGLDPNMMSELTRPHVPKYLTAMIINACGDAHINPDLPAIQNAIHIAIRCRHKAASIQPRGKNPTPAQTTAAASLRNIIKLLIRDGLPADAQDYTRKHQHFQEMSDYIGGCINEQQLIRSTTYQGLCRASEKWHHHRNQTRIAERIQREIEQQAERERLEQERNATQPQDHGKPDRPNWESLIQSLEIPQDGRIPITAVALTTPQELIQEGKSMDHCVGNYWQDCRRGNSRIFSLRRGGITIATTELTKRSGRWHAIQTRGPHNHPPEQTTIEAARALADEYQIRWLRQSETQRNPNPV